MAKKSTTTASSFLYKSKSRKKGKYSKKDSTSKRSKNYKKQYVGQGR